jgi:transcriptional regulator
MYIPSHFAAPSQQAIDDLVRQYPLAQLVTLDSTGQWQCNPLPLMAHGALEPGAVLRGHVAKANPIWQQTGAALVVFTGPQAYITPNAYPSKAEHHRVVPTYNYACVQVRGQLIAHHDSTTKHEVVSELTQRFEASQAAPWAVTDAPEDFVQANLNAIVAIEIRIESVQAKFKLSQNRNAADREGVMTYLVANSSDDDQAAMLKLMRTSSQ